MANAAADVATLRDFRCLLSHADVLVGRCGSLAAVVARLDELERLNELVRNENKLRKLQLDELVRRSTQIKTEKEALEHRCALAEARVDQLRSLNLQATRDNEELTLELHERGAELAKAGLKTGEMDRQNKELKRQIGLMLQQLREKRASFAEASGRLAELERQHKQIESENAALKQKLCQRMVPQQQYTGTTIESCVCGSDADFLSTIPQAPSGGVLINSSNNDTRAILSLRETNSVSSSTYLLSAASVVAAGILNQSTTRHEVVEGRHSASAAVVEVSPATSSAASNSPSTPLVAAMSTSTRALSAQSDTNTISPISDRPSKRQRFYRQLEGSRQDIREGDSVLLAVVQDKSEDSLDVSFASEGSPEELSDSDEDALLLSLGSSPSRGRYDRSAVVKTKSIDKIITYKWNLPYTAYAAANQTFEFQQPRLDMEALARLDAARPWDLVFDRRSKVSRIFNYQALGPKAKKWVRDMQWFQFTYRREHWEWRHWVKMEERVEDVEWEAYRRNRDRRLEHALRAWKKLYEQAAQLAKCNKMPREVWLDPSIWFLDAEPLKWQYRTSNLVREQAKADLGTPTRCFYVRRLLDHPFYTSEYTSKYPDEHALPPLVSPDGKHEVRAIPVPVAATEGAIKCPTSWRTVDFAPQFELAPVSSPSGIIH